MPGYSGWQLSWSFTAGQRVTQLWNGSDTQDGSQVTVTDASWNGDLATGASTSSGFNGSLAGTGNPAPEGFAPNGTACTGTAPPPTAPPTTAHPTTTSPVTTATVRPVAGGAEQAPSEPSLRFTGGNSLDVPLQVPPGGTAPSGEAYTYSANDASAGDLDGDGRYEIVLTWDPSNSKDNSQSGYTGNAYLDAYRLDGTRLWRIDLGRNTRAGAHYTQFQVHDYDGGGRAEVAAKTARGPAGGGGRRPRGQPGRGVLGRRHPHDQPRQRQRRAGGAPPVPGEGMAPPPRPSIYVR